jgi:MoaA/NifB/PqqE/SkfB family radical SAM enzyme
MAGAMDFGNSGASYNESARQGERGTPYINPLPAVCDVSVTNLCNAACSFCGFARDKKLVGPRRYLDVDAFARALPILRRRRIRYMTFQGGEPLLHPKIVSLVTLAAGAGIWIGLITNGWFLARRMHRLAEAGLKRLSISIDSADIAKHEHNRGLSGLCHRIETGIRQAHIHRIPVWASVTVSRLVNYDALPPMLDSLGFDAVSFSFPRREPFGSTSLVFDPASPLIDMTTEELVDALQAIERLRKKFPVSNPATSVEEVVRFVQGQEQRIPCVGGQKYFYIDWNLDIWRCEAWAEPMGSVFDLDSIPDQREPCFNCMMACYRSASAMMHGAIALTDAAHDFVRGDIPAALHAIGRRGVAYSLRSLATDRLPRMALSFRHSNTGTPGLMNLKHAWGKKDH